MTKSKRNANGMGTAYQRKDGRWCVQVRLGLGADGKPARRSIYGATQKEVIDKLKALHTNQQLGFPVAPERQTVGHFLQKWVEDVVKDSVQPTTYALYESHTRVHLIPGLGRHILQKLGPQEVQAFINHKARGGLAPRTVRDVYAVLHVALELAVKWGLVVRNPSDDVKLPRLPNREMKALDLESARALLVAASGERLEALFTVALSLGLRCGEALGLRWQDVDLEKGFLTVKQTLKRIKGGGLVFGEPKTKGSAKPVWMPETTVRALRDHRIRQIEERLAAGIHWTEHDLVFCSKVGTPLQHKSYSLQLTRVLKRAEIRHISIHSLRHTAISLLVAQGVDPVSIQRFARHAKITTTLGVYGHAFESAQQQLAKDMDRLLTGS